MTSHELRLLVLAAALPMWMCGQTAVDPRTQSKAVDFGAAPFTRPFSTGTVLPSTCTVGYLFYKSNAPAGQNLYGCTATNIWTLEAGGGGASTASQLADFQAVRNSTTNLLIGPICSSTTPCNARSGGITYSFSSPASVNISSGTGTLYIYVSSGGILTVGSNIAASCVSICTAATGVTAFPPDAIPLFSWTVTNGTLDTAGGTDFRAFLSTSSVIAATGLVGTLAAGIPTLSVDGTLVMLQTATPASSTTACNQGQWATDGTYFYLCVSASNWRRAALPHGKDAGGSERGGGGRLWRDHSRYSGGNHGDAGGSDLHGAGQ